AAMLASAFGAGALANQIVPVSAPVVTVCVGRAADNAPDSMVREEVSKIFSVIPARIVWKKSVCDATDAIHIRLTGVSPPKLMPAALASARPYQENYIEIFYDRICAMAQREARPQLLAYVLAHEITHILQGVARHSETGIMKANWTDQ